VSLLDSFLEVAGNLGFLVGDNDRRRARERKERRSWGAEKDGFSVSIATNNLKPTANDPLRIEIALRNATLLAREISVPPWLSFFVLEIQDSEGNSASLNSFGRHQMAAAQLNVPRTLTLPAGETVEAEIPVGALYTLGPGKVYTIRGHSLAGSAISHELEIRT
jgi:hypothetical protein